MRVATLTVAFALVAISGSELAHQAILSTNEPHSTLPDLYEAGVLDLQDGLDAGHFTSVDLVKAYFARIEEVNLRGPALRAVIEVNPTALFEAQVLDDERALLGKRGLLHGIPVMLKDNIATIFTEGMNTTAGSYSMVGSIVARDASVVTRLRKAGAVILGKSNLSELSHARGELPAGWSARGGQSTNAYLRNGDPCGSSSGSAIAASIGLATVTLGTETDGSITCPASYNNVVGVKPTVGLTSRAGVIPITKNQDSVGPLTRSITDAAIVLSVIAGKDALDEFTSSQPAKIPDYLESLSTDALKGKRIGVPRHVFLNQTLTDITDTEVEAFEKALITIRKLGAVVVTADIPSADDIADDLVEYSSSNATYAVRLDYKTGLNAWFSGLISNPSGVRSLKDLIAFNNANPELEKPKGHESQTTLESVQNITAIFKRYNDGIAFKHDVGRTRGIDAALKAHKLDALVLPASGLTAHIAAIAGYPIVTVPLGFFPDDSTLTKPSKRNTTLVWPGPQAGAPFGLSFLGTAYSETKLIGFGFAYEQKTRTRLHRLAYPEAIPRTQLVDVIKSQSV